MSKLLPFVTLLFTVSSFAQIELEHSYDDGPVTRVNLEYSGEKYYVLKTATNELMLYNADHTLWKTILLPAPLPNAFTKTQLDYVSEAKFNSDLNIEVVYSYYNNSNAYYETKVYSENGTVLLTIPNAVGARFDTIPGSADKLISYNYGANPISKVFSVPELALEHSYSFEIKRIKLENSGEKYFMLNTLSNTAVVFNADHTLWKEVMLTVPSDAYQLAVRMISETLINPDPLLEVAYSYGIGSGVSSYTAKIINENNAELLSVPDGFSMYVSKLLGFSDKLMVLRTQWNPALGYESSTNVYNLPSLSLEHSYENIINRTILENSGEKYYTSGNIYDNKVKIYNTDHSLWKSIVVPMPDSTFTLEWVGDVSENKFNNDPFIEFDYSCLSTILEADQWYGGVLNENGFEMLSLYAAQGFYLSEWSGVDRKLVALINPPDFGDNYFLYSKVYSLGPLASTDFQNQHFLKVSPNPASSNFEIYSGEGHIINIKMYNTLGALVLEQHEPGISKVNIEHLPSGVYILKIENVNHQNAVIKVSVVH